MGYVMFTLFLAAFTFALTVKEDPLITQESIQEGVPNNDELEAVSPSSPTIPSWNSLHTEVLNFYLVSLVFAAVGASCFLIAWKKEKHYFEKLNLSLLAKIRRQSLRCEKVPKDGHSLI